MIIQNRSSLMTNTIDLENQFKSRQSEIESLPWVRWGIEKPNFIEVDDKLRSLAYNLSDYYCRINRKKKVFTFKIMSRI